MRNNNNNHNGKYLLGIIDNCLNEKNEDNIEKIIFTKKKWK